MTKKTVKFNRQGAAKLPIDKPVVYRIQTEAGKDQLRRCREEGTGPGPNPGTSGRRKDPRCKGPD